MSADKICPVCKEATTFEFAKGRFKCKTCENYFSYEELFGKDEIKVPDPEESQKNIALDKEKEAIKENNKDEETVISFEEQVKEETAHELILEQEELPPLEEDFKDVEITEEIPVEEVMEELKEDNSKEGLPVEEEEIEEEPLDFRCGPSDELKERTALFYERYGTYEDADPYVDDELLVVCDGCGGAGASKHILTEDKMGDYEKIRNLVLPEDKNDCLKPQLEILYKPILEAFKEEKAQTRTSAFIGSRLVLPRFIYAYKKYKNEDISFDEKLVKIKNFIEKGMIREINELGITVAPGVRKSLLSTTFVSVIFNGNPDEEDEIDCDVIWAGDSRAYVLYSDGLKKLLVDDENDAGLLTNLFCIKEGHEIKINHRHYKLKKPCIVFTCSDGVFDAFQDNLSLDCLLTQFIQDCNSLEEFANHMKNDAYAYVKSDDCTMAMRMFGFKDIEEAKQAYKPRFELDERLINAKKEFKPFLDLREDPSVLNSTVDFLVQRLEIPAVLESVATSIAAELEKGNNDDPIVALSTPLYEEFKAHREEVKEQVRLAKIKGIDDFINHINEEDNYLKYNYLQVFNPDRLNDEKKPLVEELAKNVHNYNLYRKENENFTKLDNTVKVNCLTPIWETAVNRFNRIKDVLKIEDKYADEEAKEAFIKDCIENGISEELSKFIEFAYKDAGATVIEKCKTKIEEYNKSNELLEEYKANGYPLLLDTIKEEVAKLFEGDEEEKIRLFNALYVSNPALMDFVSEYLAFDLSIFEPDALAKCIFNKYNNHEGAKELIEVRITSDKPVTVLDDQLNATFLAKAIAYRASLEPTPEIIAFLDEYQAYDEAILELLK